MGRADKRLHIHISQDNVGCQNQSMNFVPKTPILIVDGNFVRFQLLFMSEF